MSGYIKIPVDEWAREHFRDETPVVDSGLYCADSRLVYPIVADIPILLIDEAIPRSFPVITGLSLSKGFLACSHEAKNASPSIWMMALVIKYVSKAKL